MTFRKSPCLFVVASGSFERISGYLTANFRMAHTFFKTTHFQEISVIFRKKLYICVFCVFLFVFYFVSFCFALIFVVVVVAFTRAIGLEATPLIFLCFTLAGKNCRR